MDPKRFVIYRDVFGGWRWEYHHPNGEIYDCRYSYDTRSECLRSVQRTRAATHAAGGTPTEPRIETQRERRAPAPPPTSRALTRNTVAPPA